MCLEEERNSESGFAILAVMLGMAVIGILALGLVLSTRSSVRQTQFDLADSQMRALSDAVILQASVSLVANGNSNGLRVDGVPQDISVLGNTVPVAIASEFGKVDLNVADLNTLARLLEAAGQGPDESSQEAEQIVDWRNSGDGTLGSRPFRVVAELAAVPGISQDLYERVAGSVTVYSDRDRVDESTAPLLALESMPGMDNLSAEAIIRNRSTDQSANQIGEVVDGRIEQGISITGWAFSIETEFELGSIKYRSETVVRMTGDPANPFLVLWQTGTPD